MASFSNSAAAGFGVGYDLASTKKDKNQKTAYQRYVEKFYGPDVTSHRDPIAVARAATGAVAQGLKTGAGWLGHAAAGLLGAPLGPSQPRAAVNTGGGIGSDTGAVSGITPTNRLYQGNPGTGAGVSAYNPGSQRQGNDAVLDAISHAEGTVKNGYNEVMGYGQYGGYPSKPLTEMTLQEVHDFGRGPMFSGQRAKGIKEKDLSSASGRYQITGNNIKDLAGRWGLDMKTTKFTPELQDKMALQILKEQGLTAWEGFKSNPKLKQQAIAALQGKPVSALAYTSTDPNLTPAQQAAAAQAAGQPSSLGSISRRGDDVAAMQRDLNSRGAKLTVDGLEGPLTRAAAQQFYGSPTSVRTGGFTNPPATTANNWSSLQGSATQTVNPRQDYVPTGSRTYTPVPASYTSGRGDEGVGVRAPLSAQPRLVQTTAVNASGYPPIQNGFVRDARMPQPRPPQTPQASPPRANNWSSVQSPYTNSTGGANAWSSLQQQYPVQAPVIAPAVVQAPTARIPQPRPAEYGPPMPQAVPTTPAANWTLADIQRWADSHGIPVTKAAGVLSEIGGQMHDAAVQGSRSGMGYSGGNYSGGSYGGAGGRSISSGVGGAFKNR